MYGHTLRTRKKIGGIVPLGGAIIEQNMKLPLIIIEFYDKKNAIFYECIGVPLRNFPCSIETMT